MLAESDGMPRSLELTSNHNVILLDSTWIAGMTKTNKNQNNNKNNANNEDEDDVIYEGDTDLQENDGNHKCDLDKIGPNKLEEFLQETCAKITCKIINNKINKRYQNLTKNWDQ